MITLAQAGHASGGTWIQQPLPESLPLLGGTFDTRTLDSAGQADTYFALKGERADGHDYLARLAGTQVKLAVVSRRQEIPGFRGAVLLVPDTLKALGDLGRFLVKHHHPKVVAITGSYGKTTAKEAVARVLSSTRNVLSTPGSLNNEIGVPITLLKLDGSQDICVLEFSARKPGDIAYLSGIAPPDVAVITAIGHAHLGVFGSMDAIYRTKTEIFAYLRAGGLALVNGEDPRLSQLARPHRTLTFGRRGNYRAELVRTNGAGRQSFMGVCESAARGTGQGLDGTRMPLQSEIPGAHGLYPVLIAWAVARELGVPDAEVVARAGKHPGQKGRAVVLKAPGGATLLDDTYNASPETVRNLVATLSTFAEPEKILVLGRLAEMEEGLAESTALIGDALRPPLSAVYVHAPGQPELYEHLKRIAGNGRKGRVPVHRAEDLHDLIAAIRAKDKPGAVIGFKAGRSSHLERAVQGVLGARIDCVLSPCGLLKHCTDCEAMTRHD